MKRKLTAGLSVAAAVVAFAAVPPAGATQWAAEAPDGTAANATTAAATESPAVSFLFILYPFVQTTTYPPRRRPCR